MDIWCWDWMHCYLVNGVAVQEIHDLFQTARDKGLGWPLEFHNYLQSFQWPRGYASASKLSSKQGHMPAGSASEYISAAPVLARFLVEKIGDRHPWLR
eukprot:5695582-Pyramimonas_sp.AAC.1